MEKMIEKISNNGIQTHIKEMDKKYYFHTKESVDGTIVYEKPLSNLDKFEKIFEDTIVEVEPSSLEHYLERALKQTNDKLAVVNPASFNDPCNMLLSNRPFGNPDGIEELLCANTNLANILYLFKNTFYEYNKHNELFTGLYSSRSLFIPDVIYETASENILKFNVISISPPNGAKFKKSVLINPLNATKKIYTAYSMRIEMILNVAYENGITNLVISGFGSESKYVDPSIVCDIFKKYLNGRYKNVFEKIVFCIGDKKYEDIYNKFNYEFVIERR